MELFGNIADENLGEVGSPGFMVRDRQNARLAQKLHKRRNRLRAKSRERGAQFWQLSRPPFRPITRVYPALRRQDGTYKMFVGIANYPGNAGHLRDLVWRALSITTGDQNAALGVATMDSAHELTYLRISRCRNRASIQNGYRAFFHARGLLQSGLKQLLLERGAIGLAGAAAEIENVKRSHGQKRIVTEVGMDRQPGNLLHRERHRQCEWVC